MFATALKDIFHDPRPRGCKEQRGHKSAR